MGTSVAGDQASYEEGWRELDGALEDALRLLLRLDRLGLDHAGAYLAMAIDVMQRQHPRPPQPDRNSRTSKADLDL